MTHSPADVVRWLLVGSPLNLGADPTVLPLGAWPLYESNEPSTPDNCVTLYDTDGKDDGRSMIDGQVLDHYGFQVRIRSVDKSTGRVKADAIRDALMGAIYQNGVVIGAANYWVHCIANIGRALFIGTDSPNTKRSLHTINAVVSLYQIS